MLTIQRENVLFSRLAPGALGSDAAPRLFG
jgi:hypothetical protein